MKDKRGFTLIELLVVLGLAGIVISVVMSFFIANYKNYERINNESELQYQSQFIINFMTNKILEAEEYNEGKYSDKFDFKYSDGTEITFKKEGDEIIYQYGTDSPVVLGSYADDLVISREGTNGVKIVLTLQNGSSEEYPAEQIIYMRNSQ
ncbi:MAG: prepilin-type N-terminal cleavage/methylation domain-containing protein [Sedimentibacter sp.]